MLSLRQGRCSEFVDIGTIWRDRTTSFVFNKDQIGTWIDLRVVTDWSCPSLLQDRLHKLLDSDARFLPSLACDTCDG